MHKVVHFVHHDEIGGGSTVIIQHLRHYGKRYETCVIHGGDGPIAQACRELGIREMSIPADTKWKLPFGFVALWWELRRLKPDLLIVHGQPGGPIGAMAGKLAGVPRMMYIVHWLSFYTDWDLCRMARNYILEKIPTALCHSIVTLSRSTYYQYLLRLYPVDKKGVILSNMIDYSRVPQPEKRQEIRAKYLWPEDCVHVAFVGRLAAEKKVDWLLHSWKLVQETGVKARLWIVGGGALEAELSELAKSLGVDKTCTFLGSKPNGIEFLMAADVVAMTTLYETNSVVPMEAMACGRAVVASESDGVRGTFEDGREGFLVPPGDVELFAERLLTLIKDPELRRRMGEAGKERAKFFAADVVLDRYVALIEKELAK